MVSTPEINSEQGTGQKERQDSTQDTAESTDTTRTHDTKESSDNAQTQDITASTDTSEKPSKTVIYIERQQSRHYRPVVNSGFFWQRHFGSATSVTWSDFEQAFLGDYQRTIAQYGDDKVQFTLNILSRDIFETKETISAAMYARFVGSAVTAHGDLFLEKLLQYVSASLALRQVLDMDSTVRMTTIRHLCESPRTRILTVLYASTVLYECVLINNVPTDDDQLT